MWSHQIQVISSNLVFIFTTPNTLIYLTPISCIPTDSDLRREEEDQQGSSLALQAAALVNSYMFPKTDLAMEANNSFSFKVFLWILWFVELFLSSGKFPYINPG